MATHTQHFNLCSTSDDAPSTAKISPRCGTGYTLQLARVDHCLDKVQLKACAIAALIPPKPLDTVLLNHTVKKLQVTVSWLIPFLICLFVWREESMEFSGKNVATKPDSGLCGGFRLPAETVAALWSRVCAIAIAPRTPTALPMNLGWGTLPRPQQYLNTVV